MSLRWWLVPSVRPPFKLGKTGKYWQMPIDKISEKAIKTFILAKGKLGTDIS